VATGLVASAWPLVAEVVREDVGPRAGVSLKRGDGERESRSATCKRGFRDDRASPFGNIPQWR
jgi:hypothetical protein